MLHLGVVVAMLSSQACRLTTRNGYRQYSDSTVLVDRTRFTVQWVIGPAVDSFLAICTLLCKMDICTLLCKMDTNDI